MSGFGGSSLTPTFPASTNAPNFGISTPSISFGTSTNPSFPAANTGLFGKTAVSTGLTFGATTSGVTTNKTANVSQGLGGVDPQVTNLPVKFNSARPEDTLVRENLLPNEISSTVETFKQFVRDQRSLSADISRGSIEPVQKVRDEIESLRAILASMSFDLQKNAVSSNCLKNDMMKALGYAEMAQKTHEVPSGLQYENTAPLAYFMELVQHYEKELLKFREKIELTDKHLHSLVQPKKVGEQDLVQGMRQIHETLIALAGRLQNTHHEVQAQKQMYMQLRRVILDDNTDVFVSRPATNPTLFSPMLKSGAGPTPFVPGGLLGSSIINPPAQQNKSVEAFGSIGSFSNTLGSTGNSSFLTNTNDSFNLQRPPMGHKRGKH